MEQTEEPAASWREILGEIVRDPQERQRVAQALGVHPREVVRWTRGHATPRSKTLAALPELFPVHQEQFLSLLQPVLAAFPYAVEDESGEALKIPSAYYAAAFTLLRTCTPVRRRWEICSLVMAYLLRQIDVYKSGIGVTIAQCVPPGQGGKVRSLRVTMGQGTGAWRQYLEGRTQFLGAGSRVGHALLTGRSVVVESEQQQRQLFSKNHPPLARSAMTTPILSADRVAGCLGIFSAQPAFFVPARQELVERYATLLSIAFEPEAWYALADVELSLMPPPECQRPLTAQYSLRVKRQLLRAKRDGRLLSAAEADVLAWQEIEALLIRSMLETE